MAYLFVIIFLGDKKLSSQMSQISEQIYSTDQKIHSYDQMRKIIVNLCSNKVDNNENSSPQIFPLYN